MGSECVLVPLLSISAIFNIRTLSQQEITSEIMCLWTLVETVVSDETLEYVVEPVQERDPVEKIASRERPFRGK